MLVIGAAGQHPARPAFAAGTITGRVFQDFNANGVFDTTSIIPNDGEGTTALSIDVGIGGVTVTAYDAAGANVGTATTDVTGVYTLTTTDVGSGPYRLEFSNWPAGYRPSASGTDNGTNVQFASAGATNVNFALNRPADYCQNNPQLATNCFFQGDQVNGPNRDQAALVSFPYSSGSNGATIAPYDNPISRTLVISASQIGTTWGLGFARSTQRLFAAAYMKKHSSFGPGGPGAIYVINPATSSVVNTFTVPNATRNSHDTSNYLTDNGNIAWDAVGKDSLGGLDLSDDEARVYVMNLENRTLYALDAATGAVAASQPVPLDPPLPGGATCPADDVRPFAVEYHNAQVFVGLVCSAESSQNAANLRAYVYAADPATLAFGPAPVFDFPLNYPRGRANDGGGGPTPSNQPAAWNPWTPAFTALPPNIGDQNYLFPVYPQPMLTGLAFDVNGDLILGLRDRFGDQTGNQSPSNPADFSQLYFGVTAGDTLRACALPGGGWSLESNGRCAGRGTAPQASGQGPGGAEFYFQDDFSIPPNSGDYHDEVSLGAVLQVPGAPEVVATMFDPIPRQVGPNEIADVGLRWLNNTSGAASKAFRLINGNFADGVTFAKANGLGDLVALCNAAPIEIGNRVWRDANTNGVQDPDEPALAGVTVRLYRPGFGPDGIAGNADDNDPLETAITSASGNYYFSSATATSTPSARYNVNLLRNTAYEIRLDNAADYTSGPLTGLSPTVSNAAPDQRDSDGVVSGGFAAAAFSTGGAGSNNHDYDFGFSPTPPTSTLSLGNQLWFDVNNNALRDGGELPVVNASVRLYRDNGNGVCEPGTGDIFVNEQVTDPNGLYLFSNLSPGNYCVQVPESNFTSGGVLSGYLSSTGGGSEPAPDPDNDVDNDDNGTRVAGLGVVTTLVTLAAGTEPLNENPDNDPLTPDANENLTVDFGFFRPYSLGNRVWFDADDDGRLDSGEIGLAGISVRLLDGTGAGVLGTTTTVANGCYRFDNLPAGNYIVEVAASNFAPGGPLAGLTSSTPDEADPNSDGDSNDNGLGTAPGANGIRSGVVTLGPGDSEPINETDLCAGDPGAVNERSNLTVDFGFFQPSYSLGNRVWFDLDNSGTINGAETGVSAVTVRLLDGAGVNVISTTTTVANGCYRFDNLPAGNYVVEVAANNFASGETLFNYTSSTPDEADPNSDGDSNDNGLGTAPGANGIRSGVVTLGPGDSEPINETDLCAGDPGAVNERSNLTVDFGFYALALGNLVWNDLNNNGLFDGGEAGLDNVPVRLFLDANNDGAPDGAAIRTTTTSGGGLYAFNGLTPTTYLVEITPLAGFVSSTGANGALIGPFEPAPDPDDDADNDDNGTASGAVIRSAPITLTPGAEPNTITATGQTLNATLDFGLFQPASLGNFVWNDDGDGVQEAGETGVPNVIVTLYNALGAIVVTTTTDANGIYTFTNLIPGDYAVSFSGLPAGSAFTLPDQGGDDALDSDPDPTTGRTITTTLVAGENDPSWDAGLILPASLGNFVWEDLDADGRQDAGEPGVPNVTVQLLDGGGNVLSTTTTNASGVYTFTGLAPAVYAVRFTAPAGYTFTLQDQGGDDALDSDADPATGRTIVTTLTLGENDPTWDAGLVRPASLGNFVWDDLNGNGVQDAGEPGLPNVTVRLLDSGGNVLSTTTTNGSGAYQFGNLPPGGYRVEFVPPAGYGFSPRDQGSNDALDSDPDPATGRTGLVNLISGQNDPTVDAGLVRLARLGDRVWQDTNANGLQDTGETGVSGVTVRLLDAGGSTISTTVTDGNGNYQFVNLVPGSYQIEFVPPAGQAISLNDQGGDDALDSDANPFTRRTPLITLAPGANDLRWDAGLHPAASVGNDVWLDQDGDGVFDPGEPGVPNVTVRLYQPGPDGLPGTADDVLVATVTTDANGFFEFTGLPTGAYFFHVTLPSGFNFTRPNQGGNDDNDSDVDPATGRTPIINLLPGQNDLTWDAGLVASPTAVELLYFRVGAVDGASVRLEWETGAEINNLGFRLLRAPVNDLAQASEVAFVPATASGASGASYRYTDIVPQAGVWWYWLVDVDTSGVETVHGPVSSGLDVSALPHKVFLPIVQR